MDEHNRARMDSLIDRVAELEAENAGLRIEDAGCKRVILKFIGDAERERMLRMGSLEILAADGIISGARARELGGYSIEEQRRMLRNALRTPAEPGKEEGR